MKKLGYIILTLVLAACGSNTFQTEAGTTVTYLQKGDGDPQDRVPDHRIKIRRTYGTV